MEIAQQGFQIVDVRACNARIRPSLQANLESHAAILWLDTESGDAEQPVVEASRRLG
jgi:hypothetical protein